MTTTTNRESPHHEVSAEGYGAALAHLPRLNPSRLRWLMDLEPSPAAVWGRLLRGRLPMNRSLPDGTLRLWSRAAGALSPAEIEAAYRRSGVRIVLRGSPEFPHRLENDPEPPALLFCQGAISVL